MEVNMNIDFVVKLGGSAVTQKDTFETVNLENIKCAARILYQKNWKHGKKFVVVHGAGSFGHQVAKQYHVKSGWANLDDNASNQVKKGFALTRLSVCKLNAIITSELVAAGLPAVSQSPCGSWRTKDDEVTVDNCSTLAELLTDGFIPVLHGDCVLDESKGCTILSGDTICQVLCKRFNPKCLIFASDVAGIYDQPPHIDGAILLKEIIVQSDGDITIPISCLLKYGP